MSIEGRSDRLGAYDWVRGRSDGLGRQNGVRGRGFVEAEARGRWASGCLDAHGGWALSSSVGEHGRHFDICSRYVGRVGVDGGGILEICSEKFWMAGGLEIEISNVGFGREEQRVERE